MCAFLRGESSLKHERSGYISSFEPTWQEVTTVAKAKTKVSKKKAAKKTPAKKNGLEKSGGQKCRQ